MDARDAVPLPTGTGPYSPMHAPPETPLCKCAPSVLPNSGTPVKLRHWQLRDLISFGRDDGELFAVHGTGIALYRLPGSAAAGNDKEGYCAPEPSTSLPSSSSAARRPPQLPSAPNRSGSAAAAGSSLLTPQRCTAMDVGFHASCMTYSDGFLAAGGQSGEVSLGPEGWAGAGMESYCLAVSDLRVTAKPYSDSVAAQPRLNPVTAAGGARCSAAVGRGGTTVPQHYREQCQQRGAHGAVCGCGPWVFRMGGQGEE